MPADVMEKPDSEVQKPPLLTRSLSESQSPSPPPYSEVEPIVSLDSENDASVFNTTDTKAHDTALKHKADQLFSSITSVPDIHDFIRASIENSLLSATGSFFDSGLFAKSINNAIRQPHSNTIINTASQVCMSDDFDTAYPASMRQQVACSQVHHRISATETLFGTIWLRTTTAKTNDRSKKS